MDNDFQFDVDAIVDVIDKADILLIRFAVLQQRLLLDLRFSEREGPLVKVVARAGSPQERFRELKRLRPRFSQPERITAIPWPKFVATLAASAIWAAIERRLGATDHVAASEQAARALRELRALERAEIRNAITGEGYRTYWERVR